MTNEQKQVIISGVLGDGHLRSNGSILLSCIHKEYMDLKAVLLGDIVSPSGVYARENNGYKKGIIYRVDSVANDYGKKLYKGSLEEAIKDIDELGLSLWFLDDGSLHKKNFFYNISTHSFPLKEQTEVLVPLLNRFGIYPKIYSETKKDGRQFNYLYVSKYQGAFKISENPANLIFVNALEESSCKPSKFGAYSSRLYS